MKALRIALLVTLLSLVVGVVSAAPNMTFDMSYSHDVYNGTYLQFWLFNLTQYGQVNLYGMGYSLMAPIIAVIGFWIFFFIWVTYLASVWMRSGEVILPIVIGIISAGVWGVLIPAEAYLYMGVIFAVCIGAVLVKMVYQP